MSPRPIRRRRPTQHRPCVPARPGPYDPVLVKGLRPFRRRAFRQRATVTLLRATGGATGVAALTLVLHTLGYPLPVPGVPLAVAGAVLLAGLCALPWQRPSAVQTAYALDRALGLHEQLITALDVDPSSGRLAARLHRQVRGILHGTAPVRALPWPSLRRECMSLVALGALLGASLLLATHTASPQPTASRLATRTLAARRSATRPRVPTRAARRSTTVIRTITPSTSPRSQPASAAQRKVGAQQGGQNGRSAGVRFLPITTITAAGSPPAFPGQRHGTGTLAPASSTGGRRPGATGRTGRGAPLSGGSHATGQRPTGAPRAGRQASSGRRGAPTSASRRGRGGQGNARSASGSTQARGTRARGGGGRAGANQGQQSRQAVTDAAGRGAGSASSHGSSRSTPRGAAAQRSSGSGAANVPGPGSPGAGKGGSTRGSGTGAPGAAPDDTGATLSPGASVTLTGGSDGGDQLTLSVGTPGRATGADTTTAPTGAAGPIPDRPGYVAPDSNAVTSEDRAVVRGYFRRG